MSVCECSRVKSVDVLQEGVRELRIGWSEGGSSERG